MIKAETFQKIYDWSINNPRLRMFLFYLFFPITVPLSFGSKMIMKWVFYKNLDKAVENKDQNSILKICSAYLNSIAVMNEWKYRISKKWLAWEIGRLQRRLYKRAIIHNEMSFEMFQNLMQVYSKYDIIGGSIMKPGEETVIHIPKIN